MAKYVKKPVTIEAIEWTGSNIEELAEFIGHYAKCNYTAKKIYIETLEGEMCGDAGDMIIKGINGEFYPCKPDIFKKTYYTQQEYAELNNG